MNKNTRVVLLDEEQEAYNRLNKIVGKQIREGKESTKEIQLLNSIKKKSELLKINPFYGNNIEKKKIPKNYIVQNLWRIELTNFWRMLYTIKGDEVEIICFILNILNHKNYNKIFGYKNK